MRGFFPESRMKGGRDTTKVHEVKVELNLANPHSYDVNSRK